MTSPAYWPTITVEFDSGSGVANIGGSSGGGWGPDLSPYVREIHTTRGRQTETQQFSAGTATILLDNQDGRFDPTYTSSAPYGSMEDGLIGDWWGVGRQVRIRATYSGLGTLSVFQGYVETISTHWDSTWQDVCEVSLVDAFKPLQLATFNLVRGAETSGFRIDAIISSSGVGLATSLMAGRSTMDALTYTAAGVLQAIQDVELSENGQFFIGKDGGAVFLQRASTPPTSAYYTLTDNPTGTPIELSYEAPIQTSFSDVYLFNEWTTTDAGANIGSGVNTDSQTAFGRRVQTRTLLINSATETQDAADYLAQKYGLPEFRLEQIAVNASAQASTHTWDAILTPDIGARVDFVRNPPGGGTNTRQMTLQSIQHDITNGDVPQWVTTLGVVPVLDTLGAAWILDDTAFSVLDSTTRLIY